MSQLCQVPGCGKECFTACEICAWFQCEEHSESRLCCSAAAQMLQALSVPDVAEYPDASSKKTAESPDPSSGLDPQFDVVVDSASDWDEESWAPSVPTNWIDPKDLEVDFPSSDQPPTAPEPILSSSKRKRSATTNETAQVTQDYEMMTTEQLEEAIRKTAQKVARGKQRKLKEVMVGASPEPTPRLPIPGATRKTGIVSVFFKEKAEGYDSRIRHSQFRLFCFSCRDWVRTNSAGEESKTRVWNGHTIHVGTMILVGTEVCTCSIQTILRHHLCSPTSKDSLPFRSSPWR